MAVLSKLAEHRKLLISAVTGVGGVCLYLLARSSYAYRYYMKRKSDLCSLTAILPSGVTKIWCYHQRYYNSTRYEPVLLYLCIGF